MPIPEKLVHRQTFEEGMNTQLARELMAPNQARRIFNCIIRSSGKGEVGIVTNPKGNELISFTLPAGTNKTMGVANDEESNKFYFFNWNSNDRHGIYMYDSLANKIIKVLENLIDTANVDILRFNPNFLILHADVVRNELLYWVDGFNNARKTNINKLLDKSQSGYGTMVLQSFIDAYKQTTPLAPTAIYFSDTSKPFNRLYGSLRKFAVRLIYDDGEISNVSDFSAVALPAFEPFTGINTIPTDNNGIKITFTTGDSTVKHIEIFMQSTSGQQNDTNILNWVSIATLDKKKLNIADNSQYTYNFYNDSTYSVADQEKIIRPHSFMPLRPRCQAFVKNAMVYANGREGFDPVDIDITPSVTYEELFIDSGTGNEFNEPLINTVINDADYVSVGLLFDVNGNPVFIGPGQGSYRLSRITVTIGNDVKKGNIFSIYLSNGVSEDIFNISYEANNTDSSITVANSLKQMLIATGRIYRETPDIPYTNIYDNTNVGGDISFSFIFRPSRNRVYINVSSFVNPVQFDTLKDTGQSVRNIKMGSSVKYGIMYEDFDGRKSLTYTEDILTIGIKPINDFKGIDGKATYKKTTISLNINHKPPKRAKYYQIMRSNDLTYGGYIQMLIQKVVELNDDDAQDYLDLVVGSLYTYQKIHPNTPLRYDFSKGDRIRLLKRTDDDTYYDFFETEVISYQDTTSEHIMSNIALNGTATVTVDSATDKNIGKIISVNNNEREILAVVDSTHYLLNSPLGGTVDLFYSYELIDRRGTLRIRKPSSPIVIDPNTMVEIYKPSSLSTPAGASRFFEFQKKFPIINAGTDDAFHAGNVQDQTDLLPAIVSISEGTAYVRNREQPLNNVFPGTQMTIQIVESESYSDFYESLINDNGRISTEDTGDGEVDFGSRMRYSNNFIEDTRINGLNDFDNTDREDYNDQYGDIVLTVFDMNRILTFKKLRTANVPVDERITQSNNGVALNVTSSKLLNPIQYYAWEGGIGDNPESFASNGTHKYWLSPNSGVIIRFGGNGEEPISKTYSLDNEVRELINNAVKNKAKIFGGFDRESGMYIISIEAYNQYIYFDGFSYWITQTERLPNSTLFEVVTNPAHGSVVINSNFEMTYNPTLNYSGPDSFTYRAFIDGVWSDPRKVCINIIENPDVTMWRQKESSWFCVLDQYGFQTGYYGWSTLEELNVFDNILTGNEKPNVITDPDYIAPILNSTICTIEPVFDDPDPFTFTAVTGADLSTVYVSNLITISGINVPIPISISASGSYRINGGAWMTAASTVVDTDTVEVRQTSSPTYTTLKTVTLTVNAFTANYNVTTKNNLVPDPFTFTPVTGAELSTVYESNGATITGIDAPTAITIVGGDYQINGGAWVNTAGTVAPNDIVKVRQTSSPLYSTLKTATATIGGVNGAFNVTTKDDIVPDAFVFTPVTGAVLSTTYTSNSITVTGITGPSPISVSGGEYQINGGVWVTAPGTVVNSNTVKVRRLSSSVAATEVIAVVTIGGVNGNFSITTA